VFVEPEGSSWLPSDRMTFRTPPLPVDTEAPSRPGTPTVTASDGDMVTLAWEPSTDNVGVHQYHVLRVIDGAPGGSIAVIGGATTSTTVLRMLGWDADYTVKVVAYDVTGNASPASGTAQFTTQPDVGSACTYRFTQQATTSGASRATIGFTNTGRPLDGWALRVSVPDEVTVTRFWQPGYTIGADVVFWHFRGGNYSLGVGRPERVEYEFVGASSGSAPLRVTLNGHPCTLT
jgi:mannan endo-1,4-beta-mannosidase